MLALLALGVLDQTRAFLPMKDVSEGLVRSAVRLTKTNYPFYPELVTPLLERGRHDLVRAIEQKIASYHKLQWKREFRRTIAKFDGIYLNYNLRKMKKLVYP